jgi:6-pyruvoyltetrahydropterin/6-carboxytetrahydropterin synthase
MFTISKQFTFSASHQLDHLPASHPCARLHGHNYTVEIVLRSTSLDERDFVLDYNELRVFNDWIMTTFDHHHLNDVLPVPPTAENIARHLYKWAKEHWPVVTAVKVSETSKTWAIYEE